jgi:hypothetical protein
MRTISTLSIASVLLSLALPVRAECIFPQAPAAIPDGKSASAAEMLAAMNAFKAYSEQVTAFGGCLDEETKSKATGSAQLMQLKALQKKKHNAAVEDLQARAKRFNEQVLIYKART